MQATPATGEAPLYVTVDETSGQSWISYTALDWDDGDIVSNPSFATSHILTLAQQYVVTLTVQNNRTGSSST
ncbi:MAG: hypothetical protein Q8O99_04910 [bacterium]|nr:hypothetical protein [bacterium]